MTEERRILEQSITNHQLAIDVAKKNLAALEVTYSIGDRFQRDGNKYILIATATRSIVMGKLSDGCRWGPVISVLNCNRIIQSEFNQEWGPSFCRYWDNRKKVHV